MLTVIASLKSRRPGGVAWDLHDQAADPDAPDSIVRKSVGICCLGLAERSAHQEKADEF